MSYTKEEVINGLLLCSKTNANCTKCPYRSVIKCSENLMNDAARMMLMTQEEMSECQQNESMKEPKKWVTVGGRHHNVEYISYFDWKNGELEIVLSADEYFHSKDPDKAGYYRLCDTVGVEPAEEQ